MHDYVYIKLTIDEAKNESDKVSICAEHKVTCLYVTEAKIKVIKLLYLQSLK